MPVHVNGHGLWFQCVQSVRCNKNTKPQNRTVLLLLLSLMMMMAMVLLLLLLLLLLCFQFARFIYLSKRLTKRNATIYCCVCFCAAIVTSTRLHTQKKNENTCTQRGRARVNECTAEWDRKSEKGRIAQNHSRSMFCYLMLSPMVHSGFSSRYLRVLACVCVYTFRYCDNGYSWNGKTAATPSTLMFICYVCVSVSVHTPYHTSEHSYNGMAVSSMQCTHPCGYDYTKSV